MKKTIRINIGGQIFHIDEDAYEILQRYLHSITVRFLDTDEGNEIIADVELRIAELFQEEISEQKQVINIDDVEKIIGIMGKPEDFSDSSEDEYQEAQSERKSIFNRQVFRDPDDRVLGGVSSGIANYFGIDPIVMRLFFVFTVFIYGSSALIYIILWIFIPEAKTTAQKLEMKGEKVNVSNIEKSVRDEFVTVKNNFDKLRNSQNYEKTRDLIENVVKFLVSLLSAVAKVFLVIVGVFLILFGIVLLTTLSGTVLFNDSVFSPFGWAGQYFSFQEFLNLFMVSDDVALGIIALSVLYTIPLLVIVYTGFKLIFRFKTRYKYLGGIVTGVWILSIISMFFIASKTARNFKTDDEIMKSYVIENVADTLYLELNKMEWNDEYENLDFHIGRFTIDMDNQDSIKLYGEPHLHIEQGNGTQMVMEVAFSSRGRFTKDAKMSATKINYDWIQKDSVLFFNTFFTIANNEKWRNQKVNITLKVPKGTVIYFGEDLHQVIYNQDNLQNYWDNDMDELMWIMTPVGLSLFGEDVEMDEVAVEMEADSISSEIEDMKKELEEM